VKPTIPRSKPGAYGPIVHFDRLLFSLQSDDQRDRQETLEALSNILFHQRTFYPATPVAIPFLIHLLDKPDLPNKGGLLYFLCDLAEINNADEDPAYQELITQTLAALRQGRVIFEQLADDADPRAQRAAKELLYVLFEGGKVDSF